MDAPWQRVTRTIAATCLGWVAFSTLAGCTALSSSALADLFASPTPTETPIPPTPTATSTPIPTPTFTPTPTPTPEPPRIELETRPEQVPQGGLVSITARSNRRITSLRGDLDGRPITFLSDGNQAWSLAGFRSDADIGPQRLSVVATWEGGVQVRTGTTVEVVPGSFRVENIQIPPGQEDLLVPAVINQEWAQLLAITRQVTAEKRWNGLFLTPAQGRITSPYGIRRSYNGGPPSSPHEGMDIGADAGDPVVAANSGVVVIAHEWRVRGNAVIIDHGMGVFSGYYHLSEIAATEGQRVTKGQLIGRAGETGLATGPHLHWDMVLQGMHTAPLEWTQREFP